MNKLYFSPEQYYLNYKWALQTDKMYWIHLNGKKQEFSQDLPAFLEVDYKIILEYV